MIAGMGGLGGFVALYLAQAGIGKLIIVDHDFVEMSNLNRQILYTIKDLGRKKVDVATTKLKEINPDVTVVPLFKKIDKNFEISENVDVIVDCLDNSESRINILNISRKLHVPYVFGAVEGYMGMVSFVSNAHEKIKKIIKKGSRISSPQVLGATAGMTAAIQALEVTKYLSNNGDLLEDRLVIYDAFSTNFEVISL